MSEHEEFKPFFDELKSLFRANVPIPEKEIDEMFEQASQVFETCLVDFIGVTKGSKPK